MYYSFTVLLCLVLFGAGCASLPIKTSPLPSAVQPVSPVLDLHGQGLTKIPENTFSQTNLTRLDLSGNRLTGAPPSQIGQLTQLTSLNLSNNALTGLPAELGRLTQLQELNVSRNQLTGLPMELGNLTQLRVLDVSGNNYSKQDLDAIAKKLPTTEIKR